MKDLGELMKQAQAMQEKLRTAQAELAHVEVEGAAGGDMVRLTMMGDGTLAKVVIDESLLVPGEGDIIADLVIAAHADARRKLEIRQKDMMREVAGPLADLPGMPKF